MNASDAVFLIQQRLGELHGHRKASRWLMLLGASMTAVGLLLALFHRLQWSTALNSLMIVLIGAMLHVQTTKQIRELEKSLESGNL